MALELIEKRCPGCGDVKPLSEFHRNKANADGHHTYCKPCALARTKAWQDRKRAEMGEEAWLEHNRARTQRHRAKTGGEYDARYAKAKRIATQGLIDAHRAEFEARMILARDAIERES